MKRIGGVVGILVLAGLGQAAPLSPAAPAGLQVEYSFAEGSGATAGDSSGNGLHSNLQNGTAWTPSGRIGGAIQLDGVNDFVALPANSNLVRNAPGATLATWINISSYPASGVFKEVISIAVNSTSGTTNTSRAALAIKGDGTRADLFAGARSTDSEAQQTLTADVNLLSQTWVHCTAVADFAADSLRIYVNGTLAGSATVAFSANSTPDTASTNGALGAQDKGDSNFLHAKLDQVRIYNRALSASEIQALASGDSLQAHWKLDDGSGLTASDASGNAHTGSLKNGLETGWVGGGQVGGALQFDGVDDYVQVDAPGILRNVNAATVAAWIKPSSTIPAGSFRELVSISVGGAPSDVSRFALALRGDGTAGDVFLGGRASDAETQKSIVADVSLTPGNYVHVAGVANFSQGTLEIYINGLLAASGPVAFVQPVTSNSASPSIVLGAQDTGGSNRYAGTMDEVRVYGRALTACEVQELAGRDGLQAYWKFDESAGSTASDSSSTGLTATLKNGATFVPGKLGNALNLDGTNQYADLGLNLPILKGANAATVTAWINLSSVPSSGAFREIASIAVGGSPSNTSRLALAIKGTGAGTADLFVGGRSTDSEAQQTLSAVAGIQPGVWRHVAATLDVGHNAIRIFLDGSQIATANVAFSQPTTPTTAPANGALGAQDLGTSNFAHAKLDEVRIYCRVLSAAEIASLAASAAPAAPVLSLVEEGNQQVKLSWTSVPGADFYNVKRSTTQGTGYVTIASPGGTTHTDLGLTNGVTYFYVVTAQNAAGPSLDSNEIPAMPRDAVPPPPVIVSPASGAILATATPTVSGTSSAMGLTITLLVDGSTNGTTMSGVAGNWSLNPGTSLSEGPHNLTATATSTSGTSPESGAVQIRIDTVAPVITTPQPPDGSSTTNATPTISAAWNDPAPGSGINTASAVIKLDNVPVSASVNATGFSFAPSALALGAHTVSAQVSDLAGNPAIPLTWSFSVVAAPTDSTPPVITNLVPGNGSFTNNPRPQVSAQIMDSGGSGINASSVGIILNTVMVPQSQIQVTQVGSNNASVAFTPSFDLGEGQNAFSVNASDNAGNPAAEASSTFTLDLTNPSISITAPADGAILPTSQVMVDALLTDSVSGIDPAMLLAELNGNNVTEDLVAQVLESNGLGTPTRVQLTGSLLAITGANMLVIRAADTAGNASERTASFTVQPAGGIIPELEPFPEISLEKLAPEDPHGGFEGAHVTTATATLRVKATAGGGAISGIRLVARLLDGEGRIIPALDRSMITNGEGIGGFRVAFGRKSGMHTVEVTASNARVTAPLQFQAEAVPFELTMTHFTDGIPGSGGLVDFHTPQFARIAFYESDSAGNPIDPAMGKVVILDPEVTADRAATRTTVICNGAAGYVIKPGTSGDYFLTGRVLGFKDENGQILKKTVFGSIQNLSLTNTHAAINSGQGQRAYPGRDTQPLKARLVPGTDPNEQNPPDRLLFGLQFTPFCDPQYRGSIYWGELIPVIGTDPQITVGGQLSLLPVNGVAAVVYRPTLPITAMVAIATGHSNAPGNQPFIPNDLFVVGAPWTYLARKKFARDSDGRIIRDSQGNASPSNEYEEIAHDSPDPYIHAADILDRSGQPHEPNEIYKFYVEMKTSDYGETLNAGAMALATHREALTLPDGYAPTSTNLSLQKIEIVDGVALYRSQPLALTMASRVQVEQEQVSVLPGNVRLLQGDSGCPIVPFVPFTVTDGPGKLPGVGREGKSPTWVFLGDSLTIGTQGKCVVKEYQEASYPIQACKLAHVRWAVAAIEEPGAPQRIWTDPFPGTTLRADPTRSPRTNPTLFAELVKLAPSYGNRAESTYGRFANVLGIDGAEIRQAIIQGRHSTGVSGRALVPGAPSNFTADYTLDVLAGMENTNYDTRSETEWRLGQEILGRNASRIVLTESYEQSQVEQARRAAPDLVSIFLGNNDTLQAVLNGDSIQARVTPFDDFNPALHRTELVRLQPVLDAGLAEMIPTLFGDTTRNDALGRVQYLTTRSALDHIVSRVREVPGDDPTTTKLPDVVIMTLPDTTKVPILVPIVPGATLGGSLRRTDPAIPEKLPFRIVFFGVDITQDIHNSLILSDSIMDLNAGAPSGEAVTPGRFAVGTVVSLAAVLDRFGRRADREVADVVTPLGFFSELRFVIKNREQIRLAVSAEVQANWTAGRQLRDRIFGTPFAFRRDEVLLPGDVLRIRAVIGSFNDYVKNTVGPANNYAVFDVNDIFEQASGAAGFIVRDAAGQPFEAETLRTTWRGKLVSLDGGHPGNLGHLVLGGELLNALKAKAAAVGRDSYGGVHVSDLSRPSAAKLAEVRATDQAIIGAGQNP